jgi:hypothetical protein
MQLNRQKETLSCFQHCTFTDQAPLSRGQISRLPDGPTEAQNPAGEFMVAGPRRLMQLGGISAQALGERVVADVA